MQPEIAGRILDGLPNGGGIKLSSLCHFFFFLRFLLAVFAALATASSGLFSADAEPLPFRETASAEAFLASSSGFFLPGPWL